MIEEAAKLNRLSANTASAGGVDEKGLRKACQEFEAIMLHQLLKGMRKTVMETGFMSGGYGEKIFRDMHDQALTEEMAKGGGVGLADMLYRQLLGLPAPVNPPGGYPKFSRPAVGSDQPSGEGDRGAQGAQAGEQALVMPVAGEISSPFGMRWHPILNRNQLHQGMDLAAPEGTPVMSAADGRVVFSGWREGYGNLVEIDHGGGLITRYGHNQENLVAAGDSVNRGQVVAQVGSTGLATGPHLHFETRQFGRPVDPRLVMEEAAVVASAPAGPREG